MALVVLLGLEGSTARAEEPDRATPAADLDDLVAQQREVGEGPPLDFYAPEDRLRELVETALAANPAVREVRARYRAALERIEQVRTLPDPVLSFTQALRSIETRVGPQRNALTVSQSFPWFGTLDLRGRIAFQNALAQFQLLRAREREVVRAVKRAYYELAYLDRAVAISREEQSLLEHYEELAQIRYATGQGLQQNVVKLQAEITRVLDRLDLLARQRATMEARLNTLVDRPPHEVVPPVPTPELPAVELDLERLYARGEAHREELRAAAERIRGSEQAIELAKKDFWPDFFVGVGLVNVGERGDPAGLLAPPPDNGKNALSVSAGITIPIWRDKYAAAVREASETLTAERQRYADLRNEMELAIREQVVRLETLENQIRLFDEALLPQAEQALRSTEAAYETGLVGVLELLDSERVLLQVRLVRARYAADYLVALADLERALGMRFP